MQSINENNLKRLSTIVDMVDNGSKIADIGSDHCYVPILCCKEGKIAFAQAIDNKKGPYERMVKAIENSGYSNMIEPSLSSGLDELDDDVDTLILAGMGGKLIISILEKNLAKLINIKTIIVDAHNDRPELIKFLENNSYHLEKNQFLYEGGIAYDIMKWKKGKSFKTYTEEELIYGPLNLITKSDSWRKYWLNEEQRIANVLSKTDLPIDKRNEYEDKLKSIRNVLEK